MTRRSALVLGSLVHARSDEHARRAFRYPVYVASIDLAELPALDRELRLFSHGRRNLFALHDRDYEAGAAGLSTALADLLAANRLPAPHTTRLVTNLRVAESEPPGVFDSAALESLRHWRFQPRIVDCASVPGEGLQRIDFRMSD